MKIFLSMISLISMISLSLAPQQSHKLPYLISNRQWGINHHVYHNMIYRFVLMTIQCYYHKVCQDTFSILFNSQVCNWYNVISYVHLRQSFTVVDDISNGSTLGIWWRSRSMFSFSLDVIESLLNRLIHQCGSMYCYTPSRQH